MILKILTWILFFFIGAIIGRFLIIFACIAYNIYRVHSKFNRLYATAKDERMRRDLVIDYNKMDKSIPVDIMALAFKLNQHIDCDDLLSNDLSYFLYEF